jgi:hypothetical protein
MSAIVGGCALIEQEQNRLLRSPLLQGRFFCVFSSGEAQRKSLTAAAEVGDFWMSEEK